MRCAALLAGYVNPTFPFVNLKDYWSKGINNHCPTCTAKHYITKHDIYCILYITLPWDVANCWQHLWILFLVAISVWSGGLLSSVYCVVFPCWICQNGYQRLIMHNKQHNINSAWLDVTETLALQVTPLHQVIYGAQKPKSFFVCPSQILKSPLWPSSLSLESASCSQYI